MDFDTLWLVADRARERPRLIPKDVAFIRDVAPDQLESFPRLELPTSIRHPAGFSISGASVGTFVRSALLIAGQRVLGNGVWHHALAFSPRLSEGCALLRPVHACGDSCA